MDISLKCRCGALRGVALDFPGARNRRMVCLCDDCQAYAHHLGRAGDVLDANGGTDIVPCAPASLRITEGREHIRCVRLSPKGLMRWYAGCCQTPIANSLAQAKVPFHGVVSVIMDHAGDGVSREKAVGPIGGRIFGKYGIGRLPPGTEAKASIGTLLRTVAFLGAGVLRGRAKPSPFFDEAGKPVTEPYVLTRPERDALRPLCGPKP